MIGSAHFFKRKINLCINSETDNYICAKQTFDRFMKTPETAREIILSLEQRFNADKIEEDLDIIFHFDISGANGGQFTVHLEDDACKVSEGLSGDAKCTITCKDTVYADIELGKTNAQMAFMMGRIKISNIAAMMRFIECFDRLH